jgi:fructuronate reductase
VDALVAELGGATPEQPAATAVGLLVRGLAARFLGGGTPVTVLSCDNMAHNGKVLKGVVDEFIAAAGPAAAELTAWLAASTTWPSSMVDRITPAVTPQTLDRVEEILGARDEAAISGEPFRQWVIEDSFAAPRPQWELVGAQLVDAAGVGSWEEAKLRMLNGTHSLIAYAGRLFGYATMAEAVVAPEIAPHARTYMVEDALPSVTPPAGADLPAYGEGLLERFANPATGHSTRQVSTDGTQKIPFRWGGALKFALASGRVPQGIAFGLAAWSEFVRRAVRDGVDLGDPAGAEALTAVVTAKGADDVDGIATALLALPGVLPGDAGTHPGLVAAVVEHARALAAAGDGLL